MNSILSALAENFTDSAPPLLEEPTVPELLASLQALQEGRWSYSLAREATGRVLDAARDSALSTRRLVLDNPGFCAEYRGLLARLTGSYQRGVEALEQLAGELERESLGPETLQRLEEARQASLAAYQALQEPVLRCPRCASRGETCAACGLEGMMADPSPPPETEPEALSPSQQALYRALVEVAGGQVPLSALEPPLRRLHEDVQQGIQRTLGQPPSERREALLQQAQGMLQGLEVMATVFENRELATLLDGWAQLYAHHCAILDLLAG